MAAVYPAGPDPMMIRSRTPSCSAGGIVGSVISPVVTAGPGGGKSFTGGTTRIVRRAFPAAPSKGSPRARERGGGRGPFSAGRRHGDLGDVRGEAVLALDEPGDPHQHVPGVDRLVEGEVRSVLDRAVGGHVEAVQVPLGIVPGADLDRGAGSGAGDGHRREVLGLPEVEHEADAVLEVAEGR